MRAKKKHITHNKTHHPRIIALQIILVGTVVALAGLFFVYASYPSTPEVAGAESVATVSPSQTPTSVKVQRGVNYQH